MTLRLWACRRYSAGDVPPDDARVLQGAAVPGRGLGDHRAAPRAGHAPDGRAAQVHADHLDRCWSAALALAGIPPFAGFFSKDAIIEAVHLSTIPGHGYAYFAVMAGVFITAFYIVPHAVPDASTASRGSTPCRRRHDDRHDARRARPTGCTARRSRQRHHGGPPKESPWVVTVPLILLAIPVGLRRLDLHRADAVRRLFRQLDRRPPRARGAVGAQERVARRRRIRPARRARAAVLAGGRRDRRRLVLLPRQPGAAGAARSRLRPVYTLLENNYYFDRFNDWFFAGGARGSGAFLSNVGDRSIIDGFFVNGSASVVGWRRRCCATCSPATSTTTRSR